MVAHPPRILIGPDPVAEAAAWRDERPKGDDPPSGDLPQTQPQRPKCDGPKGANSASLSFNSRPNPREIKGSGVCVTDYGYRYYHPELGRWISRDPIGEKGGVNVYAFAGNKAANHFDLFGLEESPDECKQRCEREVNDAQNDDNVKRLYELIKSQKNCKTPKIGCYCGDPKGQRGSNDASNQIMINCSNKSRSTKDTLIHELTHALQNCSGGPPCPTDKDNSSTLSSECRKVLCKEMQAYATEGICDQFPPGSLTRDACISQHAVGSALVNPKCAGYTYENLLGEGWYDLAPCCAKSVL